MVNRCSKCRRGVIEYLYGVWWKCRECGAWKKQIRFKGWGTGLFLVLFLMPTSRCYADTLFNLSAAVAVVGHGADLATTQRCLGEGRCVEVNPWLLRYQQPVPFAVAKMSVATVGIWAASKIPNRKLGALVNFAVGSGFLALAAHNEKVRKR